MLMDAVYPGHAVAVALCIALKYDDLRAAEEPGTCGYLRALEDPDVPGAGDCVHAALDFLRAIRDGQPFEAACKSADAEWARVEEGARRLRGQQQADSLKSQLRGVLREKWGWPA